MPDYQIYARFSSIRQDKGSSIERQLETCRAFIARNGGTEVGEPIIDKGKSAWKGDHLATGKLGKYATAVHNGEVAACTLVVEHNDRLSRQHPLDVLAWIVSFCKTGMAIAIARTDQVYEAKSLKDGPPTQLMQMLWEAYSAYQYTEVLSDRVTKSYRRRIDRALEDGTAITTLGPAWLKGVREEGSRKVTWVPIPERAALVREIYDRTAAGVAPWNIAKELNQRENCSSFGGGKWERTAILKILRNPAVEGTKVVGEGSDSIPTGEIIPGYYGKATVPADVVAAARAMLDRRRRKGSGRNSGSVINLFGQKIRCGQCGGRMMTTGYQSRYLTCYEAARGNGCGHRSSYKYRPFEAAALNDILPYALDDKFFRQAEKSNTLTREIADVDKALRDAKTKAEFAYKRLERDPDDEVVEKRYDELRAEVKKLKATLDALNQQLEAARGKATAVEHSARIHAVKDALTHEDEEVRRPARLRVTEVLQAIIQDVRCETVDGVKRFEVILSLGAYAVQYDNAGVKLAEVWANYPAVALAAQDFGDKATVDMARRIPAADVPPLEPLDGKTGKATFFGQEGPQGWTPEEEARWRKRTADQPKRGWLE